MPSSFTPKHLLSCPPQGDMYYTVSSPAQTAKSKKEAKARKIIKEYDTVILKFSTQNS